jgi:hypothetical protein
MRLTSVNTNQITKPPYVRLIKRDKSLHKGAFSFYKLNIMIFTAIGIVFLLTLGFLVITWVIWFTFLWLSKLWYETSQTYFNRTTIRTFINHSSAVLVSRVLLLYSKASNRVSKMNDNLRKTLETLLLIILVGVAFSIGYSRGYGNGYKACSVNYGISK